jgi:integrase
VSRPAGRPAPAGRTVPGQAAGSSGLLEKLAAAVRPEFRADVLVFDPADPVFGGSVCLVEGCARTGRHGGMCHGHRQRWIAAGRPDPGQFPAAITAPWHGHGPLASGRCRVPGCGFGVCDNRMCPRHARQWRRAGRPDPGQWAAGLPPATVPPDAAACLVAYCDLWAHPGTLLCWRHCRRWRQHGMPDPAEFARACETPPGDHERADLTSLPRQLKLELQYALQRRRDDNTTKTRPHDICGVIKILAGSGATSLLMLEEQEWRRRSCAPAGETRQQAALLSYAYSEVCALAEGEGGWDSEYPRDTWRLRRLGITGTPFATLQFGGITQPWLKDLAKRWTRWRISTGLSITSCYHGLRAVTRFAGFAAHAGIGGLHQADRGLLERYLACLHRELGGNSRDLRENIGALNTFLLAIRRHGWDESLPATALFFAEDYPRRAGLLPRALAAHVAAQAEDPANLDRWDNPAYRLITVILIRCGLRISSATTLPWNCITCDADGAPYLRYRNTKMKREALVPIDEELVTLIGGQHDQVRGRWPEGTPVLFPRPLANIDGTRPIATGTYRSALPRWLADCDIRDEHGQPVHLTPHQWRHTLGTWLINRDVPQHVVQKILDHDTPEMTAHYARLSDKTVRGHWEKARKVSAAGQIVQVSPDGPLGDAAWAKHQLSRATQALPNGYCQLPVVKTCPHANAPLTELTSIFQQFIACFR